MHQPESSLPEIAALIRSKTWIEAPTVEPLEPVIRSGDQFIIRDPTSSSQTGSQISEGIAAGRYLGAIVIEWGYEISDSRSTTEFERWLVDFEEELENDAPPGVHYRGTYAVISSTTPQEGRYQTLWGYDDTEAINQFGAAMATAGSRFAQLIRDLQAFTYTANGQPGFDHPSARSQRIYQVAIGSRRTKK